MCVCVYLKQYDTWKYILTYILIIIVIINSSSSSFISDLIAVVCSFLSILWFFFLFTCMCVCLCKRARAPVYKSLYVRVYVYRPKCFVSINVSLVLSFFLSFASVSVSSCCCCFLSFLVIYFVIIRRIKCVFYCRFFLFML